MASFPIPCDVVGTILEQLRGDNTTLKNCALVSHSFHLLSRPWLFSIIILQTSMESQRLWHLLTVTPAIAPMIRELFIEYSDNSSSRLSLNDPYLPTALRSMSSLHRLSFHNTYIPHWHELSSELRSAIAIHFKSLVAVKFSSFRLPVSLVTNFSKLRSLSLHNINLHDDDRNDDEEQLFVPVPMLAQLEALELAVNDPFHMPLGTTASVVSQAPNLKLLSILLGFRSALPIILEAMRSSAESIETILLSCWMSNPDLTTSTSPLGVLHNLRSLVLMFHWEEPCRTRWLLNLHLASLVSHFEHSASSKNLKELTIAFDPFSGTDWGNEVIEVSTCRRWGDLDTVLSRRCPALEQLQIFFRGDSKYVMDDATKHIQDAIGIYLPSLTERGLLSVGIASLATVRGDAWSRAGY